MGNDKVNDFSTSHPADDFQISERTIRLYEEKGLLSSSPAKGNHRSYTKCDRARLRLIGRGERHGYSLDEITEMIGVTDMALDEVQQTRKSLEYAQKKLDELMKRSNDQQVLEQVLIACDIALLSEYVEELEAINAEFVKEPEKKPHVPTQKKEEDSHRQKTEKRIGQKEGLEVRQEVVRVTGKEHFWKRASCMLLVFLTSVLPGDLYLKTNKIPDAVVQGSKRYAIAVSEDLPSQHQKMSKADEKETSGTTSLETKPNASTLPEVITSTQPSIEREGLQGQESEVEDEIKQEAAKLTKREKSEVGTRKRGLAEIREQTTMAKLEKLLPYADEKLIIRFGRNSKELSDESREALDILAALMTPHPEAEIVIEGYTDSRGDYNYNEYLSKLRADLVKSYLVDRGLSPSNIKTFGMGPEDPIASNETAAGRDANRRVEIRINLHKPRSSADPISQAATY